MGFFSFIHPFLNLSKIFHLYGDLPNANEGFQFQASVLVTISEGSLQACFCEKASWILRSSLRAQDNHTCYLVFDSGTVTTCTCFNAFGLSRKDSNIRSSSIWGEISNWLHLRRAQLVNYKVKPKIIFVLFNYYLSKSNLKQNCKKGTAVLMTTSTVKFLQIRIY